MEYILLSDSILCKIYTIAFWEKIEDNYIQISIVKLL